MKSLSSKSYWAFSTLLFSTLLGRKRRPREQKRRAPTWTGIDTLAAASSSRSGLKGGLEGATTPSAFGGESEAQTGEVGLRHHRASRRVPPWSPCPRGGWCCCWPCPQWPRPGCIGCRRRCRSPGRSWWRWCSDAAGQSTCSRTGAPSSQAPPGACHPPSARWSPRRPASSPAPCAAQHGEARTLGVRHPLRRDHSQFPEPVISGGGGPWPPSPPSGVRELGPHQTSGTPGLPPCGRLSSTFNILSSLAANPPSLGDSPHSALIHIHRLGLTLL